MNCAKEKQLQAVSFAHVRGLAGQVQFERCPERVSSLRPSTDLMSRLVILKGCVTDANSCTHEMDA